MTTYFSQTQLTLLSCGAACFISSLTLHCFKKYTFSVILLACSGAFIFSFAALLDPFLNLWDERFHALVAKNMMKHPFVPTLYDDPVVSIPYEGWDKLHVWLHKQPLFLWQIALSFKIFGVSEFSLRLPNVVMGTILVLVTYRSGTLLVNRQLGFIAASLFMSSVYMIELVAGKQELEHNDFAFLFYVSLSIWSFIEYYYSGKRQWIWLIGLFSGMAILCKWLVGLLVYSGWAYLRLRQKKYRLSENKDIFLSLLVTILVAAPWQVYTWLRFPQQTAKQYSFYSQHYTKALDGHEGNLWYHFDKINDIYGWLVLLLCVPAFVFLYRMCKERKLVSSLIAMIAIVYAFYTFAATKMPSFTTIVCMVVFIALASLLEGVWDFVSRHLKNNILSTSLLAFILVALVAWRLNLEYLQEKHTTWKEENHYTRMFTHNRQVFTNLKLPANTVLFNVKGRHYVEAMFYTGLTAYNFVPSYAQYLEMKTKHRRIAVFKQGLPDLPDYLSADPDVIVLDEEIQGYE